MPWGSVWWGWISLESRSNLQVQVFHGRVCRRKRGRKKRTAPAASPDLLDQKRHGGIRSWRDRGFRDRRTWRGQQKVDPFSKFRKSGEWCAIRWVFLFDHQWDWLWCCQDTKGIQQSLADRGVIPNHEIRSGSLTGLYQHPEAFPGTFSGLVCGFAHGSSETFASNMYDVEIKQEAFNRFLKGLKIQL